MVSFSVLLPPDYWAGHASLKYILALFELLAYGGHARAHLAQDIRRGDARIQVLFVKRGYFIDLEVPNRLLHLFQLLRHQTQLEDPLDIGGISVTPVF
jgi:hypothetical protein